MDPNILIICITVIVCAVVIAAAALGIAERYAELRRPRSLAEIIAAPKNGEASDE